MTTMMDGTGLELGWLVGAWSLGRLVWADGNLAYSVLHKCSACIIGR